MESASANADIPRVSVLMTIYNAEPYLRQSIDSLIGQSFRNWELIAVENGSTDASPSILAGYSDPRIRLFSLPKNIGRTPALRYAADQARGEFIAALDADDIAHPERLFRQVSFLDEHSDVALVGSWAQYIDGDGNIFSEFKPPVDQAALQDCLGWIDPIVHSSATYRRHIAVQFGGYPAEFVFAQDFGLVLAIARRHKVAVIGEFLCQLRVIQASMTRAADYRVVVAREVLSLFESAARFLPLSAKARRLNGHTCAVLQIKLGISAIRAGAVISGAKLIVLSLVREPSVAWNNGLVRRLMGVSRRDEWFQAPYQ